MAKARKRAQSAAQKVLAAAAEQMTSKGNELELDDEDEDAENDVIAELRGLGAGEGYKYRVYKVGGKPGEAQGYCATYEAGDLTPDAIRDQFGGGKYRIRVVDAAGLYKGNATMEIVGLPKAVAPAAPAAPPAQDYNGIAAIIAALKAGQPAAEASGGTTMALMLGMIENQGKMFTAMMNANKGPSAAELITLMNANKGGGADKSGVELLLEGFKLAREMGGGDAGTSELDVANKGLELLGQFAQQRGAPALPAPVAPHAPRLPAPAAVTAAAPAAPAGGDVGIMEKLNWLRGQTAALLRQASRDKDPELYAEVMLDNLPPFISPQELLQRMSAPDAVQQLAAINGDVLKYQEWFEDFRQEVVRMLTEAAQEQPGQPTEAAPAGAYAIPAEGMGDGGDGQ